MKYLKEFSKVELIYDIIIGDFGRKASVEFIGLITNIEKSIIDSVLSPNDLNFFDEYRRLMFSLVCEVEWFKRYSILESLEKNGLIDRDVLIGLGNDRVADEFVLTAKETVSTLLDAAIKKGYCNIRLYIPCNGLSDLVESIGILACNNVLGSDAAKRMVDNSITDLKKDGIKFSVVSVPQMVVRYLSRNRGINTVIILGTVGVNDIYKRLCEKSDIQILDLSSSDYGLINDAIIYSIAQNEEKILELKDKIVKRIINKHISSGITPVVIEACTDFKLDLGISSLEIFAKELLTDVYGSLDDEKSRR